MGANVGLVAASRSIGSGITETQQSITASKNGTVAAVRTFERRSPVATATDVVSQVSSTVWSNELRQMSDTSTYNSSQSDYMRSIPILCQLYGMKPFSPLYAFMGDIDITQYLVSCVEIVVNNVQGKFEGWDECGPLLNTGDYPRRHLAIPDVITGDVHYGQFLRGQQVYASIGGNEHNAICVAAETRKNPTTKVEEYVLYCVIPRNNGSITAPNITTPVGAADFGAGVGGFIYGRGQGINFNTGTSQTLTPYPGPQSGDQFAPGGYDVGKATIVSYNSSPTLKCNSSGHWYGYILFPNRLINSGVADLKFNDVITGETALATSEAMAQFTSSGTLTIQNRTIMNSWVSVPHTTTTTVHTPGSRVDTVIDTFIVDDPLTQSFVLPEEYRNGAWVTSIDIFFAQKASTETQPVTLQIVEMVDGYPSRNEVGNSTVIKLPVKITASTDASIATNFKFTNPVYLISNKEYGIKLLSNSVTYKVYIAQMGESTIQDITNVITKQPSLGVLFKSQNNSTWTADQNQDLMFRINAAKFKTDGIGNITLTNTNNSSDLIRLPPNPFKIITSSTTVLVKHPNHGRFAGSYVTYSGSNASIFNAEYLISSVIDLDNYLITVGTSQSNTDFVGGNLVKVNPQYKYDILTVVSGPNLSQQIGTNIDCYAKCSSNSAKDSAFSKIYLNTDFSTPNTRYLYTQRNETAILGGSKSLEVNIQLSTTDSTMSPLLDLTALKANLTGFNINNPAVTDINQSVDGETIFSGSAGLGFVAATKTIESSTVDLTQFTVGSIINISGTASNNDTTGTVMITDIDFSTATKKIYVSKTLTDETLGTAATIKRFDLYIDEISPNKGSASSKYQTREISLNNSSTAIRLMFGANIPNETSIEIYYRTSTASDLIKLADKKWTKFVVTLTKNIIGQFYDREVAIENLIGFNKFQIKFVLKTTNTVIVPRINKFRAIALA